MFTIKKLLHLLEKENHSWKNPTAMTKTILMVLTDYHYPSDIASKVFLVSTKVETFTRI